MKVLLVLAGTPPSARLLKDSVNEADLIVAVDGGANVFLKHALEPDILIGDLDSSDTNQWKSCQIVHETDQESTDLQKTLRYLNQYEEITGMTLLGALGGRTDHLINNLKISQAIDPKVTVKFLNDGPMEGTQALESIYRLTPRRSLDLRLQPDTSISIIALDSFAGLSTTGLKWDLDHVKSSQAPISQSNRTLENNATFKVQSGILYISVYQ